MYIIDNDGLANSDKRFPTKLRNNRNGWMHDEISGWVSTDGDEMPGLLEARWMTYDDSATNGTTWIDEQGRGVTLRKAEPVPMQTILGDKALSLLPEHYLRGVNIDDVLATEYLNYQGRGVPASALFRPIGGNSGLTEEYLYSLLLDAGERRYSLLTGSMDVASALKIHRCRLPNNPAKLISVYTGGGLHVVRKGKAGHVNFLPHGDYTLNDDAYLLADKGGHGYKLSLEWIAATHKHIFEEYASNSTNSTWNKQEFFKYATFDIPAYEEQLEFLEARSDPATQ